MKIELHCGDCMDVLATLPPASVDFLMTSPPYARQRAAYYGGVSEECYPEWTVNWMEHVKPLLKPRGSVLINIREHIRNGEMARYVLEMRLALRDAGWIECDELIWLKPNAPPVGNDHRPRRSWDRLLWFSKSGDPFNNPRANGKITLHKGMNNNASKYGLLREGGGSDYTFGCARTPDFCVVPVGAGTGNHHSEYPIALSEWTIKLFCPPRGTVLDPFAGSGTTGIACFNLQRSFIGIERDTAYFAGMQDRIRHAINEGGK